MEIRIKRGESCTYNLTILGPGDAPYYLQAGEILRFGVKRFPFDTEYLLKKELTAEDLAGGVYPLRFKPEDTLPLESGSYVCDAGVQSGPDYYYVLGDEECQELPEFKVLGNVTSWEAQDGT